jgi:hypothetical protein
MIQTTLASNKEAKKTPDVLPRLPGTFPDRRDARDKKVRIEALGGP